MRDDYPLDGSGVNIILNQDAQHLVVIVIITGVDKCMFLLSVFRVGQDIYVTTGME